MPAAIYDNPANAQPATVEPVKPCRYVLRLTAAERAAVTAKGGPRFIEAAVRAALERR